MDTIDPVATSECNEGGKMFIKRVHSTTYWLLVGTQQILSKWINVGAKIKGEMPVLAKDLDAHCDARELSGISLYHQRHAVYFLLL